MKGFVYCLDGVFLVQGGDVFVVVVQFGEQGIGMFVQFWVYLICGVWCGGQFGYDVRYVEWFVVW